MMKDDPLLEWIHIVGEKKREDLLIALTGKEVRSANVEHFLPGRHAPVRAWITSLTYCHDTREAAAMPNAFRPFTGFMADQKGKL
jgi:hypothetical protein